MFVHKKGAQLKFLLKSLPLSAVFIEFFYSIIGARGAYFECFVRRWCILKSIRFSILSGVAVAACLAVVLLVIDYTTRARLEAAAKDTLNEISLPLLQQGDPTLLFSQLDKGVELISPSMSFLTRYLPLVTLETWEEGRIDIPAFYAQGVPYAELGARAHYSGGIADVRAAMVYRDGEWRISDYQVIQGPAAQ